MKTKTTRWKWLGAAVLMSVLGIKAQAAGVGSPSYLNIDVTISASKSVSVIGAQSSTDTTTTWTGQTNTLAPSTVAVRNDSGIISEGWQLSTNANSLTTGVAWARQSSSSALTADQFAVQAVFASSNTSSCASMSVNSGTIAPPLTTVAQQYTNGGLYADTALGAGGANPDSGNNLFAYNAGTGAGQRALCWRVIFPPSTTATSGTIENIQVIVTAN